MKGKSVCLICGDSNESNEKANLQCHYSAKQDVWKGQVRVDEVAALRWSLIGQQPVLSKPQVDQDNGMQASFVVVSELIAKKL